MEEICGVTYAECAVDKLSFVAVAEDGVKKEDAVRLKFDLSHMFIFDADTRLTLLERDGGYKVTDYPKRRS